MSSRESELPHKLLMTGDLKPPSRYKKFLSRDETVTGKTTEFAVSIKNIGDKATPKGHAEIVFEKPIGMISYTRTRMPIEMPVIKPNKSFVIKHACRPQDMIAPGLWYVNLKVKFKDKEKIEYYQHEEGQPNYDRWLWFFQVVDRHQLDLHKTLVKLLERREE